MIATPPMVSSGSSQPFRGWSATMKEIWRGSGADEVKVLIYHFVSDFTGNGFLPDRIQDPAKLRTGPNEMIAAETVARAAGVELAANGCKREAIACRLQWVMHEQPAPVR